MNSSIGGTVLVQDEVYNGNHNRAGEIGHMRLEKMEDVVIAVIMDVLMRIAIH